MSQGYKTPPDQIDMQRAEHKIRSAGALGFVLFGMAVGAAYWLLPVFIAFPVELGERLAFAARAGAVVLFCVLVGVGLVSTTRRFSPEDIGGSAAGPPSERLAIYVAFLQNTLEQAVLAVGFYVAYASLVAGAWLSLIPVSVAFFIVGRVLFLRGYRQGVEGRALGMVLTMTPAIVGYPVVFILILTNAITT
ncbi:hypothetical protein [Billgrantia ethanolica]|uniref:MAPEG family protein n=1 Tax=Billgrantia ethanolica TaxID=2733486 RepID=A0ABS8ZYB0_9GAMM|nr:hypothetical protein [Halomonas ethanolica]MCE8001618.1 MAPEG family protein [Halomonas ethanolica]